MWRQHLSAVKASGCLFTGSSGGYDHSILTKDADSRAGQIRHTHAHTDSNRTSENWRASKQTATICSKPSGWRLAVSNKGPSHSWLQIIGKQFGGGKKPKQKNLSSPRASWRTGQIPIGAAVRRARSTLAPQMGFLKWDRRAFSFGFVTTSIAIVASTDCYHVVGGHKMETELLVSTKLWGETITSVLQETLISF